jgi:hypothetical protein
MKLTIFLLTLAVFIQTAFLPVNLVLIFLISRTLVIDNRSNLHLALYAGVLMGVLMSVNIGFYPLLFLVIVQWLNMLKKLAISNSLLIVPVLTFLSLLLIAISEQLFLKQSFNFMNIIVQSVLSLPIYILIRFWEERFIVAPPLKLKFKR